MKFIFFILLWPHLVLMAWLYHNKIQKYFTVIAIAFFRPPTSTLSNVSSSPFRCWWCFMFLRSFPALWDVLFLLIFYIKKHSVSSFMADLREPSPYSLLFCCAAAATVTLISLETCSKRFVCVFSPTAKFYDSLKKFPIFFRIFCVFVYPENRDRSQHRTQISFHHTLPMPLFYYPLVAASK